MRQKNRHELPNREFEGSQSNEGKDLAAAWINADVFPVAVNTDPQPRMHESKTPGKTIPQPCPTAAGANATLGYESCTILRWSTGSCHIRFSRRVHLRPAVVQRIMEPFKDGSLVTDESPGGQNTTRVGPQAVQPLCRAKPNQEGVEEIRVEGPTANAASTDEDEQWRASAFGEGGEKAASTVTAQRW